MCLMVDLLSYVSKIHFCCTVPVDVTVLFLCNVYWTWFLGAKSSPAPDLQLPLSDLGSGWSGLALTCLASHNTVQLSQE